MISKIRQIQALYFGFYGIEQTDRVASNVISLVVTSNNSFSVRELKEITGFSYNRIEKCMVRLMKIGVITNFRRKTRQ